MSTRLPAGERFFRPQILSNQIMACFSPFAGIHIAEPNGRKDYAIWSRQKAGRMGSGVLLQSCLDSRGDSAFIANE
jgi:hypothetical protein